MLESQVVVKDPLSVLLVNPLPSMLRVTVAPTEVRLELGVIDTVAASAVVTSTPSNANIPTMGVSNPFIIKRYFINLVSSLIINLSYFGELNMLGLTRSLLTSKQFKRCA